MATLDFVRPWPGGIIPYKIEEGAPSADIERAIREIERHTFLSFKALEELPGDGSDCVRFVGDGDFVSNPNWEPPYPTSDALGYTSGITTVHVKEGFLALHQIGHLVGLINEHQRSDRDKYVQILTPGGESLDYARLPGSDNQDLRYNGRSVMHCGPTWRGGRMRWIGGPNPGQQWTMLTDTDARSMNRLCSDLLPAKTPAWIGAGCCQIDPADPAEDEDDLVMQPVGSVIRGGYWFAREWVYAAALPTFEVWGHKNGVVLFGNGEVEVRDVDFHELGLEHPADKYDVYAGRAFVMAHRYATKNGFASGFPSFEAWNGKSGVVLLRPGTAEVRSVSCQELGLEAPITQYSHMAGKAIRMAHRYAVRSGFATGYPNFETWNDRCGVVLVRNPSSRGPPPAGPRQPRARSAVSIERF